MHKTPTNPPRIYCSALSEPEEQTAAQICGCLGLGNFVTADQADWLILNETDSTLVKPNQKVYCQHLNKAKNLPSVQIVGAPLPTTLAKQRVARPVNHLLVNQSAVLLITQDQQIWLKSALAGRSAGGFLWLVAVGLARASGLELTEALVMAGLLLNAALRTSTVGLKFEQIQPSDFPLAHVKKIANSADFYCSEPNFQLPPFLPLDVLQPKLYPIVDRANWLPRLAGVRIVQLRIKDLKTTALKLELHKAIKLARQLKMQLFINDYWQLAIECGAYGVHLGQEDLETADLESIHQAGLRLGVSTHCYLEAAVSKAINPSYMAFGPVFFTQLKAMKFAPQGVVKLHWWRQLFEEPLVAIGGIQLKHAQAIQATGADFVSVISDIAAHPNPEFRVQQWLKQLT